MLAKCLQTMLEARFPEGGMTRLERRIANYVDPRFVFFWLSKLCILWQCKRTIPPRFKGCHLSLWNWLSRTKDEMEAKYMVEEVVEPVEVQLPDPALSPTSKLIHNNENGDRCPVSVAARNQEIRVVRESWPRCVGLLETPSS